MNLSFRLIDHVKVTRNQSTSTDNGDLANSVMVRPLPNEFCPLQNKDFSLSVYGVSAFGYCHLACPVCHSISHRSWTHTHASEKIDMCSSFNGFDLLNIRILLAFCINIFNYRKRKRIQLSLHLI